MATRHEYRLDLGARAPAPAAASGARTPGEADREALAQLMIDAYRRTIDDGGETIDDARAEVGRFLAGEYGAPVLAASRLLIEDGAPAGACVVSMWQARGCPIVAFVMTGAAHKGRGLAGRLLRESLGALAALGYSEVRAVITEGNTPSERLFAAAGFERVPR